MACDNITTGDNVDCDNIPSGGTKALAVVLNYDDVLGYTTDVNGKVLTITKAAGKQAFAFVGFRNDVKKSEEVVTPEIGLNNFKHNAGWVIYSRTQVQKNNIERLSRGRFIVILENKGQDPDAIEILGLDSGVQIVAGPIRNAYENGGFFVVNFSTLEGDTESKLPQTLGSTYLAGKALRDGLLSS